MSNWAAHTCGPLDPPYNFCKLHPFCLTRKIILPIYAHDGQSGGVGCFSKVGQAPAVVIEQSYSLREDPVLEPQAAERHTEERGRPAGGASLRHEVD